MSIDVTCSCGTQLQFGNELSGTHSLCSSCGGTVHVPIVVTGLGPPPVVRAEPNPWAAPNPLSLAANGLPMVHDTPLADRPRYGLFSPNAIGVVAFLAGPAGAIVLMAINFWRLGKQGSTFATLVIGLMGCAALLAVAFAVPDSFPSWVFGVPTTLLLWAAANSLQGEDYKAHRRSGGKAASGWAAAGIALLGLVAFVGVAVGAGLVYEVLLARGYGEKIELDHGNEVYFTNGVSDTEARKLGAMLQSEGYFGADGPAAVRISRDDQTVVMQFIVEWSSVENSADSQQWFSEFGGRASQEVFHGRPVNVELCDEYFTTIKRL